MVKRMTKKTAKALGLPLPGELKWAAPKASKKRGRPWPAGERRTARFGGFRCTAAELAAIEGAAKLAGFEPADWVRRIVMRAAAEAGRAKLAADRAARHCDYCGMPTGEHREGCTKALTAVELAAVAEGEAYRLSGKPGISLDEAEAALERPLTGDRATGGGLGRAERLTAFESRGEMEPARTVGPPGGSKSVARRLAFSGGPPPACTCLGCPSHGTRNGRTCLWWTGRAAGRSRPGVPTASLPRRSNGYAHLASLQRASTLTRRRMLNDFKRRRVVRHQGERV